MRLADRVERDLVAALKERDATTLSTLRLLKTAAKNAEVEKRAPLDEDEYVDVLTRQAKLRREAAAEYERAGRLDRAEQERAELSVLLRYMPEQMDDEAIVAELQRIIDETGARGPGDVGKVMSQAMRAMKGKAEGGQVNRLARDLLSQRSA